MNRIAHIGHVLAAHSLNCPGCPRNELRGRSLRTLVAVGLLAAGLFANPAMAQSEPGEIEFGPAPPVFPPGAEMAVLQGDPHVAGEVFTVRLRFPDGYVVPAHWHPTDEHVTVISGTLLVGLGDSFDEKTLLPPLESGGFITAPANVNHFATARGETEVQVHAMGPFELTYVNPEDDPRTQAE